MITNSAQLASLIEQIESADRAAVDTEADSLHSYREKLCLLQISVPAPGSTASRVDTGVCMAQGHEPARGVCDFMVDPLANTNLEPLRRALEAREIVLHGADYDLRMLRRGRYRSGQSSFISGKALFAPDQCPSAGLYGQQG